MAITGNAQECFRKEKNVPDGCHFRRTRHRKKRMENTSKALKPFLLPSFHCHFIYSGGEGEMRERGPGILATKILQMQTPQKCATARVSLRG